MINETQRKNIMETMEAFNDCDSFLTILTYQIGFNPGETDTTKIALATELWAVHDQIEEHTGEVCRIFLTGLVI